MPVEEEDYRQWHKWEGCQIEPTIGAEYPVIYGLLYLWGILSLMGSL